jgi:multiple sugar transport system substrate-binding protein
MAGLGGGDAMSVGARTTLLARRLLPLLSLALLAGCRGNESKGPVTIRMWAMGREGEVVQDLVKDFEREQPGIRVQVQQVPWSAAHEKMLTSHNGHSTPDLAQLGNTWVSEFSALQALEPLDARIAASSDLRPERYFDGIWSTNVVDSVTLGVPWYVDTRVLFYRKDLLKRAGYSTMPTTWEGWLAAMEAIKRVSGPDHFAIFLPTNDYMQPLILAMQTRARLLRDDDTRGAFSDPEFKRAFHFYLELFRRGLAPPVSNSQMANLYQEFERGYFAMYITGPWNLGEFRRRLPPELADAWGTAPMPGPDGDSTGVSTAGGSSLVIFRGAKHKDEAWKFIEFLSRPNVQARFYRLTGDLPARQEAWEDSALANDPQALAFRLQLRHTVAQPKIPEWEMIAIRLQDHAETAIRGAVPPDSALANLDRDVDRILEKRRWLIERDRRLAGAR